MRNQFQNQKQLMKCMHDKFERALIFSSLGFYQIFFFFVLIMYINAKNGICRRIHFYLEWIVFYFI